MTRLEDGDKVATGPLSVSYRPPHFAWCAQDVNGGIVHIREQPHEWEATKIVIFIHTERFVVARQEYIHDQREAGIKIGVLIGSSSLDTLGIEMIHKRFRHCHGQIENWVCGVLPKSSL